MNLRKWLISDAVDDDGHWVLNERTQWVINIIENRRRRTGKGDLVVLENKLTQLTSSSIITSGGWVVVV